MNGESINSQPFSFESYNWFAYGPGFRHDVVIHLGAHIQDISEREKGGIDKYQDIGLDLAVMRYVAAYPPKECFVYPSSCSIDSAETDPYAFSKTVGERMALALHKQGVPVVILRPFSGYGPDQAESYPFPAILTRAMNLEYPLKVWGSGKQERDWIHIDDLARAFVWAIKDAPRGFPIEIGTGEGMSLEMLAYKISIEVSRSVRASSPEQERYSPSIQGDSSKPSSSMHRVARTVIASRNGFNCEITIEEGIRRAVKYRMESR